jgi:hypothetical protein
MGQAWVRSGVPILTQMGPGSRRSQGPGWTPASFKGPSPWSMLPGSLSPGPPRSWKQCAPQGPKSQYHRARAAPSPGPPESKATVNPPSTQSSPETQRAKPQPPRWVGKRSSALIGIFQLREHSIPFSLVSSNYQMFSFSGRPETAKICGI